MEDNTTKKVVDDGTKRTEEKMNFSRQQIASTRSLVHHRCSLVNHQSKGGCIKSQQHQHFSSERQRSRKLTPAKPERSKIYSTFQQSSSSLSSSASIPAVDGITSIASNYFTSLRTRAAALLAESLPPSKRDYLLKSLNAVDEKYAVENTRKSIGEAVVSALEEETKRSDEKWKEKVAEIEQKAEAAAMERIINEMKIQVGKQETIQQQIVDVDVKSNTESQMHHPLLGVPIVDLGYKAVYSTSVKNLKTIPVWERQRAYRHERAKAMAADKIKRKDIGLPGIIALHEVSLHYV